MSNRYTSLHAHSRYSVLDAHIPVETYVAAVAAQGHTHAALTDHGSMAGLPKFFSECDKHGVIPIAGMEAYLCLRPIKERAKDHFHLTLLALNRMGYENLVALSSIAHLDGFYRRPRIDLELLNTYSDGIVCCSGCYGAAIPQAILAGKPKETEKLIEYFLAVFGERFFLELHNHGDALPGQIVINKALVEYSRKYGIPAVGANDSHYCTQGDYDSYVRLNELMGRDRGQAGTPYTWVRSNAEMMAAFGDSVLLDNTLAIARMVEPYRLGSSVPHLPDSPWEAKLPNQSPAQILRNRAEIGLLRHLGIDSFVDLPLQYEARLDHELETIAIVSRELGAPLERYFLNVGALAEFMHRDEIRFNTRGSAAGSLVCWALGISDLDPIAHQLMFERFLNPYRVALPDIDIDVPDDRRDDVYGWLKQTYGDDRVARIGTHNAIKAKEALRSAARILAPQLTKHYELVGDELSSCVPHAANPGEQTLAKILDEPGSSLLAATRTGDNAKVLAVARQIEGCYKSVGTHAGGIVIADIPIQAITPVRSVNREAKKTHTVSTQTQFEMGDLEDIGLIKFDILGLSELSKMDKAMAMIDEALDLNTLDWEDAPTWDLICEGATLGLFQLAGPGMTRLLRRMHPRSIAELAQIIAIFRPGPLANQDEIVDRKHGRHPVTSIHPAVDDILAPTFGFPIFQEQLIEIVKRFAGYSAGEADLLRKAVGKKDTKLMASKADEFQAKALAAGRDLADITIIWDYIVPFASYGFNLAHATNYAYVGFKSAYLKAHYPAIFYAAAMQTELAGSGKGTKQERVGQLIHEAKQRGVTILPPDLNTSRAEFTVEGHAVRFGLHGIKGISKDGAAAIALHAPYTDFADLVKRAEAAGKDDFEVLIAAGVLPWGTRPALTAHLEHLLTARRKSRATGARKNESATSLQQRKAEKLEALIAGVAAAPVTEDLPLVTRLQLELEHLGMLVSDIPEIPQTVRIAALEPGPVTVAGILAELEIKVARRSKNTYARCMLIDETGAIKGLIWPRAWAQTPPLAVGDYVYCHGKVATSTWEGDGVAPPSCLELQLESVVPYDPAPVLAKVSPAHDDITLTIPETTEWSTVLEHVHHIQDLASGEGVTATVRYGESVLRFPCDPVAATQIRRSYGEWLDDERG